MYIYLYIPLDRLYIYIYIIYTHSTLKTFSLMSEKALKYALFQTN